MSALVAVFAQAYRDTSRALIPLQRAGIAREMLNANQAARPFWEQSLDLAERLGLLQRVVEIATTDATIAAFHRPISLAYEAHLAEQAAADAAPTPPAPLDPGSPDEARRAIAREAELLEPYVNAGLAIPPTTPAEDTAERRHVIAAVADLRAREEQLRAIEQAAYARGRDDERRRCTRHAHILAARAFAGAVEYPDVLATAEAISSGKAAP